MRRAVPCRVVGHYDAVEGENAVTMPTAAEWKTASRTLNDETKDRAYQMLLVYQIKRKTHEPAEQVRLLRDLRTICATYKSSHGPADPGYALYIQLGMQTDKELQLIQTAQGGWDKIRQVFGPANHAHGPTRHLQHYGQGNVDPTSGRNYWLEGLDPQHRSWGHMDAKLFDGWYNDQATSKNFWDWLEEHHIADDAPGVQYLAPDQRWQFMCVFGNDRIMYRHCAELGGRGEGSVPLQRFTTFGQRTAHSGKNFAIWVCSPGGIFYTHAHVVSQFHHSTFLAGGRVLGAGEWVVSAGKILLITHKTGHYAASPRNLFHALLLLKTRVDLSRTVVQVQNFENRTLTHVTASEYLAHQGDASQCAEIQGDVVAWARARCNGHMDWDNRFAPTPRAFSQ